MVPYSTDINVSQLIEEEFKQTIPIIHKESEYDYRIIQFTRSGVARVLGRVSTQEQARKLVNCMLLVQMKSHPVGGNQTG
ncbi:hypothetical protein SAMN05444392_11648 [Seinonella peptonophila]|uniref:Uncharacterized protein n=1 Tax=Seinonella peptonophila TaxID=112248 RepID=A0A1M5AWX3_9BACL|nr:hypothetical protein [Seinonella peptonophila]SHF34703.1 hypothetical protein SAMN05444392_11648 [Seinonella peptonophila]